jgi:DNA-binding transcriptional MocR family regulator
VMLKKAGRDLEISERAARQNLYLWPLSPSYLGNVQRNGFILGFGSTAVEEIPRSVRKISSLLSTQ